MDDCCTDASPEHFLRFAHDNLHKDVVGVSLKSISLQLLLWAEYSVLQAVRVCL